MDIMELGAIKELVGGVAVLATLLYLAMQVRQSNRLKRAESERSLRRDYLTAIDRMDPVLFRRAVSDCDALSGDDKQRFHQRIVAFFAVAQVEFSLIGRDLAEQSTFHNNAAIVEAMTRAPGIGARWSVAGASFEPPFRAYIDDLARTNAKAPAFHEFLSWLSQTDLACERA